MFGQIPRQPSHWTNIDTINTFTGGYARQPLFYGELNRSSRKFHKKFC